MQAVTLAALAATGSTVVGLINIGATARLARRQEGTKWTREQLPQLVYDLENAFHACYMALFEADWAAIEDSQREEHGFSEFSAVFELTQRLVTVASPQVNSLAQTVEHRLDAMRFFFLQRPLAEHQKGRWPFYWAYVEANHAFVNAARRNMGLRPLATPPGLERYRSRRRSRAARVLSRLRRPRPDMEHPTDLLAKLAPVSAEATQD